MANSVNDNKLHYNIDDSEQKSLTLAQKKIGLGLLGRLFGAETASTNVAGAVLLILVLPIPILCFFSAEIDPIEYIKSMGMLIGIIIGYFFSKKSD